MGRASKLAELAGSYGTGGFVGMKNRIINGAMMIDQRNLGAAKTLTAGAVAYVLDRFYVATNGGAGVVQQVAGSGGFIKAMRITGASGVTDGYFGQKIESLNIADCASSTVTYKIRASSSVLTSLTWYARFPTAKDNYAGVTAITSGSITINSAPTDYSFQISLPSGVTNGFELYFTFGTFTSGTLDITGVQLEKGGTATSFDYRDYVRELQMCQRHRQRRQGYFRMQAIGGQYEGCGVGTVVEMLATPSVNIVSNGRSNVATAAATNITPYGCFLQYGGTVVGADVQAYDYVDFESEL